MLPSGFNLFLDTLLMIFHHFYEKLTKTTPASRLDKKKNRFVDEFPSFLFERSKNTARAQTILILFYEIPSFLLQE